MMMEYKISFAFYRKRNGYNKLTRLETRIKESLLFMKLRRTSEIFNCKEIDKLLNLCFYNEEDLNINQKKMINK